jgi:hypothetical protein
MRHRFTKPDLDRAAFVWANAAWPALGAGLANRCLEDHDVDQLAWPEAGSPQAPARPQRR